MYNNPIATFELSKLKKRCRIDESNHGIIVSEKKAIDELLFYRANDLPQFNCDSPNGVTNVRYDVDCSLATDIPTDQIVQLLKGAE